MKNETQAKQRPLIVVLEEAKKEIVGSVNGAIQKGVPFYLLQDIINNIANQVSAKAAQELERAKAEDTETEKRENKKT